MTTAERMDQKDPDDNVSPEQVRRGRRTALLLFAIGFGPDDFCHYHVLHRLAESCRQ